MGVTPRTLPSPFPWRALTSPSRESNRRSLLHRARQKRCYCSLPQCPPPHMFTGIYISFLLIKCCSHMTSLTTR